MSPWGAGFWHLRALFLLFVCVCVCALLCCAFFVCFFFVCLYCCWCCFVCLFFFWMRKQKKTPCRTCRREALGFEMKIHPGVSGLLKNFGAFKARGFNARGFFKHGSFKYRGGKLIKLYSRSNYIHTLSMNIKTKRSKFMTSRGWDIRSDGKWFYNHVELICTIWFEFNVYYLGTTTYYHLTLLTLYRIHVNSVKKNIKKNYFGASGWLK